MKNIMVAMDFSTGALNALDFAIKIANSSQSNIILVWIDTCNTKETTLDLCKNEIRRDAKLELHRIVEEKSDLLKAGKIKIKMRKGKVYQELALQAKASETELIVVGTHGISGFEEFWIGSNAYKVISYASCPVISVQVDYDIKRPIKTIVLPIDNSIDSTKKVPMAVKLAKAFESEIHLLSIYTTNLASIKKKVDRSMMEAEKYLIKESVPYIIKMVQSTNLPISVVDYAKKVNANMIVIMTDQEKANLNILMGDYSQKIINISTVPILSVKPKNLFN
ncbi:MAG: universal stress protein [Bacteroidales bacterium]|jgi:nucleotide-binding universal stress UspA family protein|nr:universal stress protein [Bacteroidales bacterium]